ncbi:MAG: hypothetical protein V1722_05435 [Candidatus Micrarchaeota archaeon]
MVDEIEEDKFGALQPIVSTVKKIGIAKIILIAIIILGAYWFLTLPKPASLNITVQELDSDQVIGGAVVSLTWPNGALIGNDFAQVTDDTGKLYFENVPAQQIIELTVDEIEGLYEGASSEINLNSGEDKNIPINLAKKVNLALNAPAQFSTSKTCTKQIPATVENKGESSFDVELIATGDLKDALSSTFLTLAPGETANITVSLDSSKISKTSASGELRVKGTRVKKNLNITVKEAPRVDVTPNAFNCPSTRETCSDIFTIQNRGADTLTNLQITASENLGENTATIAPFFTKSSIAPGEEAKFSVTASGTTTHAVGVITIQGDCFSKQIDAKIG